MRTPFFSSVRFVAVVLALAATACGEPAAPVARNELPAPAAALVVRSSSLLYATLAGVPDVSGVPYAGNGVLGVLLGRSYPPGPCRPEFLPAVQRGQTLVSLCAYVNNAGGGTFVGGALVASGGPSLAPLVRFEPTAVESAPCRGYIVRGALLLDDAVARAMASRPGDFGAIFGFQEVNELGPPEEMRGTFGAAAPPDPEGGFIPVPTGDPACVVNVTAATTAPGV